MDVMGVGADVAPTPVLRGDVIGGRRLLNILGVEGEGVEFIVPLTIAIPSEKGIDRGYVVLPSGFLGSCVVVG